jgi:hypothetical protein
VTPGSTQSVSVFEIVFLGPLIISTASRKMRVLRHVISNFIHTLPETCVDRYNLLSVVFTLKIESAMCAETLKELQ